MQPLWRTVWRFLKNLKIELPYDPAVSLLHIYLHKTLIWKDMCTPVFTEALFTIAWAWKQPKCPSSEEWIKKTCYTRTMGYCLVSRVQLFCGTIDCTLPGSSVHGILQLRVLQWVAIPFSRWSSQPRDQTWVSCIGRQIVYHWTIWEDHNRILLSHKKEPNHAICSNMDGPRDSHIK